MGPGASAEESGALRRFRPFVIIILAWLLATNQVLSRHGDSPPGDSAPVFQPAVVLLQPVYVMFYTFVLASLFSMAWMEYDERAGSSGDSSSGDSSSGDRVSFMRDSDAFFSFVMQNSIVCASGLALGAAWGVYLRRVAPPPNDDKTLRLHLFYFCCAELVLALTVAAAFR
jgi:hypothetical protein